MAIVVATAEFDCQLVAASTTTKAPDRAANVVVSGTQPDGDQWVRQHSTRASVRTDTRSDGSSWSVHGYLKSVAAISPTGLVIEILAAAIRRSAKCW